MFQGDVNTQTHVEAAATYVSRDGTVLNIFPLHINNTDELEFVRSRLELETGMLLYDLYKKAQVSDPCSVFLATKCPADITTVMEESCNRDGKKIGFILLDYTQLSAANVVGISWISVIFQYRQLHIGRFLVQHAERFCATALGATRMETPFCFDTRLMKHQGYCSVVHPVVYRVASLQKKLTTAIGGKGVVTANTNNRNRETCRDKSNGLITAVEKQLPSLKANSKASLALKKTGVKARLKRTNQCHAAHDRANSAASLGRKKKLEEISPAVNTASSSPPLIKDYKTAGRKLSSCHSNEHISKEDIRNSNRTAQEYFSYSIPDLPEAFSSKEIYFRAAAPEDRKQWCALLAAACQYNVGSADMQIVTLQAPCRIVAVRSADETVVGLVALQAKGWISFIVCDINYREKGLGSFLLFLALEWLRVRKGRVASLTPLNRRVMRFYHKWGFQAYPSENCPSSRSTKKLSPADIVMEREIDADVYLLPNGKPLKFYVRGYDPTGEVAETSPWYYYFYTIPARKRSKTIKDADRCEEAARLFISGELLDDEETHCCQADF